MLLQTHILATVDEACVPPRLAERIEQFIDGVTRVDIQVRTGTGWEKVNAVHLEGAATPDDIPVLSALVKACADDHAEQEGHGSKYRALIRRRLGPVAERRVCTFTVETRDEQRRRDFRDRYEGKVCDTPIAASMRHVEMVALYNMGLIDCLLRMQRRQQASTGRTTRDLAQLMMLYHQGLQMKEEAQRELAEAKMQQVLETMQAKSSAKAWDVFGPVVEGLVEHVRSCVRGDEGGAAGTTAAAWSMVT